MPWLRNYLPLHPLIFKIVHHPITVISIGYYLTSSDDSLTGFLVVLNPPLYCQISKTVFDLTSLSPRIFYNDALVYLLGWFSILTNECQHKIVVMVEFYTLNMNSRFQKISQYFGMSSLVIGMQTCITCLKNLIQSLKIIENINHIWIKLVNILEFHKFEQNIKKEEEEGKLLKIWNFEEYHLRTIFQFGKKISPLFRI